VNAGEALNLEDLFVDHPSPELTREQVDKLFEGGRTVLFAAIELYAAIRAGNISMALGAASRLAQGASKIAKALGFTTLEELERW